MSRWLLRGIMPGMLGVALACAQGCKSESGEKPSGLPPSAAPAAPTAPTAPPPAPAPPSPAAAEAVPAPADPAQSISGIITLPAARKKDVTKGDTMFLIARKAGGPAGPGSMLAVQKLIAADFPMPFSLSARDAMIPGTPFDGEINLSVRVDKDGDPITRKKGDVFGEAKNVRPGAAKIEIPLDTLQKEDKTLGGPGAMGGGAPSGHP